MTDERPHWLTDEKLAEAVALASRVVHNEQPERLRLSRMVHAIEFIARALLVKDDQLDAVSLVLIARDREVAELRARLVDVERELREHTWKTTSDATFIADVLTGQGAADR